MRFLIAGSSGFLGTQLRGHLAAAGHDVLRLVRSAPSGAGERRWDPYAGPLATKVLDDVDVVVNLAGAPLIGNPHSEKWRRALLESRVTTTRVLAEAIAARPEPPVFLAGNGISYYGDRGDAVLDETSPSHGDSLLTRVSEQWQAAADPAVTAGARVVFLRTAPVLDRRSAPVKLLAPLFRLGLGGPLGDGRQYFPCLTTHDWLAGVRHCAEHADVSGPVNLTLPVPATNADFTRAFAAAVHRPAFLRVPAFVLRPAAGDLAPEVLGSVRALPKALLDSGFTFAHPDIESAVRAALRA